MNQSLDATLGLFRRLLGLSSAAATGDGDLLDAFVRRRDERAFEELVRRHGPMVLGVCRRVLRESHAADDAFQVTFLTLACKASSLRGGQALPAWLHRVAFHVALRVRSRGRRAREIEREAALMSRPESADESAPGELSAVLDEELQRLPDGLRGPLVLCGLEGKTHEEAARELGWPAGSLSKRLARGRELLRKRLARRGFELGGAAATSGLIGEATAAVPPVLMSTTVGGAVAAAAGHTGRLSATTVALLREVLGTMFWTRAKVGLVVLLALAVIGPGVWLGLSALDREKRPAQTDAERPERADASPEREKLPPEPPPDPPQRPARKDDPPPEADAPGTGKLVAVLGGKKFRFSSVYVRAAYSPDGKLLAVSDYDTIHLYDAATKAELRSWDEPGAGIKTLAFSPDSKVLATAGGAPKVLLWDVDTGKLRLEFAAHRSGTTYIVFSPDGTFLATTGHDRDPKRPDLLATNDYSVRLWDAKTGKETAVFQPAVIAENCVAFSPDSRLVAWCGLTGKVQVSTVVGREEVFAHTEKAQGARWPITALDLSPDGKVLAVGTEGVIKLFDVYAGKLLRTLAHEPKEGQPIPDGRRVHFSPDGKTLASVGAYGITLWDVASGTLNSRLHPQGTGPADLTFSPDGKKLASPSEDLSVRFWDVPTGKEEPEPGHPGTVGAVALSPDGKVVVTGSIDGVRFWDRRTGKQLRHLPDVTVAALVYGRDGLVMLGGAKNETFHLLDPDTGKDRGAVGTDLRRGMCMAVSPDGKLLAVAQQEIRVVELPSGKEKVKLAGHGSYCSCLAFGPDGKTLVSGGQDTLMPKQTYGVKLWDLATGREVRTLLRDSEYALYRAACSPDGPYVLTNLHLYDFGAAPVKDLATAEVVERQAPGHSFIYPANPIVFSPDGQFLALATGSGQLASRSWIDLYDTATWEPVARLEGHTQRVVALSFSADGRFLVSGSTDATARVWDIPERKK
jgi:RNA polymerase sigma factor (sigma-70 family)